MLLDNHDDKTSIEECLLVISENAARYLYLLSLGQTETEEFAWLANAIDYQNVAIADMVILGLIETVGLNEDPTKPDVYSVEPRGFQLLEYAKSCGVDFEDLAVSPKVLSIKQVNLRGSYGYANTLPIVQ